MELENNTYQDNFIKSSIFKDKLNHLDSGIDSLLDEFKKLYVIVNMHPTNQEYQQQYQNIINNLARIKSTMFSVSNEIQINVDVINKKLLEYDVLIREEKRKNKDLKIKLGIVENQNNAASEMITDYKDIYDKSYLRNWSLILSSIICLVAVGTVYKKPTIV
jgi:uncharacterized protein YdiU (UPF0061 family)